MSRPRIEDPLSAFPAEGRRVVSIDADRRAARSDAQRMAHWTDAAVIDATRTSGPDGDAAARELHCRVLVAHLALLQDLRPAVTTWKVIAGALLTLGVIQFALLVWSVASR